MPATRAYPTGIFVPSSSRAPEARAESDSAAISGPSDVGDERSPAATASPRTATLTPLATRVRAGQREGGFRAVTGRPESAQQRLDRGQQLGALPDHRPTLAHHWPRNRAPAGPRAEQQVVVPGWPDLAGHVLREPLAGRRARIPEAGNPPVR